MLGLSLFSSEEEVNDAYIIATQLQQIARKKLGNVWLIGEEILAKKLVVLEVRLGRG